MFNYPILNFPSHIKTLLLASLVACGAMIEAKEAQTQTLPKRIPASPPPSLQQAGPGLQAKAAYWLQIKVNEVEKKDDRLTATAVILETYKTQEDLAVDTIIKISYPLAKRPVGNKASHSRPRKWVPALSQGQHTYAFLNKDAGSGIFRPAAEMWSFAPPFGLTPDDMKETGMKMPKPPTPPPTTKTPPKLPKLRLSDHLEKVTEDNTPPQ